MSCCGRVVVTVKKGSTGLVKAYTPGFARATVEEKQRRRDICRTCPERTGKTLTNLSFCRACACHIQSKTRVASETCPKGLWQAFKPPG